jgi:ribosomal protein S27E
VSAVCTYLLVSGKFCKECSHLGLVFQTDEGRVLCHACAHLSFTLCSQLKAPLNCQ